MIEVVKGSLLDATEKYIAHQCNAVTSQAGGLAHYIFRKYPYSNIYESRPQPYRPMGGKDFPGNIVICGDGVKDRHVINCIAQYYPGKVKDDSLTLDGYSIRKAYFRMCLTKIAAIKDLESIAFPSGIGAGMAGGVWSDYKALLESFADSMNIKNNVRVVLYDNSNAT
jgi:O-acetyl-ADP-ribose deacetylase (regulator of RNase III)